MAYVLHFLHLFAKVYGYLTVYLTLKNDLILF